MQTSFTLAPAFYVASLSVFPANHKKVVPGNFMKIMVNGKDKSRITDQYLSNQRRQKVYQQKMLNVQSVGPNITRFKK